MNGWDQVVRPERALGVVFAFTGLARSLVWWIDREEARRRKADRKYHRLPLGYCDDW